MAESAASNKMISIVVSIFTSGFTVNLLYDKSGQKGFWPCALLLLYTYVQILEAVIIKWFYTRQEANDIDKQTIHQIFLIVDLTIVFITVAIILDIAKFFIAITCMKWYDYINILAYMVGFTLFIFPKFDFT